MPPFLAFSVRLMVYWSRAGVLTGVVAFVCAADFSSGDAVAKSSFSMLFRQRSKNLCLIVSIGNKSKREEALAAIWYKSGAVRSATSK